MSKKALTSMVLAALLIFGLAAGWLYAFQEGNELLFNRFWVVLLLAAFLGLLTAGFTRRQQPKIVDDKVFRHDNAAILEHWTHAAGTFVLIVSGIVIGFLLVPNGVSSAVTNAMLNIHYVGALYFLFGTYYYFGNSLDARDRVREHLPTKNAIRYTLQHYGHLIGLKNKFPTLPSEKKYFESEKMAYVLAIVVSLLLIVSGFFKASAHVFNMSEDLMGIMTLIHDVSALFMILFFVLHVFFAAMAPGTRPVLRSMLTGYLPLDVAEREHCGWVEELRDNAAQDIEKPTSEANDEQRDRFSGVLLEEERSNV
ncbi:MAG: cytochrome b/b6 domain-containing protein [Coriobacteriia bacterium]